MCKCLRKLSINQGMLMVKDELVELISEPSKDEFADVCFTINRFIANRLGKEYVRILPWDRAYIEKALKRKRMYGCVRSLRHDICVSMTPSQE